MTRAVVTPYLVRMRMSGRWLVVLALVGVAGLFLLIAAERFGRHELIGPGLLLFAVGALAAGANAILSRYTYERSQVTARSQIFEGPAAVLIGLVLVILGLAFAAAGVSFVLGVEAGLYAFLLARPGFALVPLGSAFAAAGGARVIGARNWRGSTKRLLASIPERIGGSLLLLSGLALVAVGAFEIVMPEGFDGVLAALLAPLREASMR